MVLWGNSWTLDYLIPHVFGLRTSLSYQPQMVRIGPNISTVPTLSTGSPQGCMLSPFLFTLHTSDCTPIHTSNTFVKYAGGRLYHWTRWVRYRDEVDLLMVWFRENNLLLNTSRTKESIIDFWRNKMDIQPILIVGTCVEKVRDFHFLGDQRRNWPLTGTPHSWQKTHSKDSTFWESLGRITSTRDCLCLFMVPPCTAS